MQSLGAAGHGYATWVLIPPTCCQISTLTKYIISLVSENCAFFRGSGRWSRLSSVSLTPTSEGHASNCSESPAVLAPQPTECQGRSPISSSGAERGSWHPHSQAHSHKQQGRVTSEPRLAHPQSWQSGGEARDGSRRHATFSLQQEPTACHVQIDPQHSNVDEEQSQDSHTITTYLSVFLSTFSVSGILVYLCAARCVSKRMPPESQHCHLRMPSSGRGWTSTTSAANFSLGACLSSRRKGNANTSRIA